MDKDIALSDEKRIEKDGESLIIGALRKQGLWAMHVDCNIDGFPDIMAVGQQVVLVEMKYARGNPRLQELMQPTQPVFMRSVEQAGYDDCLLCVYDGETFDLYDTHGIITAQLADARVQDLKGIVKHRTPEGIASIVATIAEDPYV